MAEPELPSPPFVPISGLPNFRDLGGYPVGDSKVVRRGLVFRSSEPSKVTDDGVSKLQDLGIAKVFDLRSAVEIEKGLRDGYGWKIKEWDGASRHFVPVFLDQDYSPEALAVRYKNYSSEHAEGFIVAYSDILVAAASPSNSYAPFKTILEHLASPPSSPPTPCLIHCTAGKDRTGVICGLILSLCGVPDEVVAHEYSLTDLGLKSRHEELISHLMSNPTLRDHPEAARRMVSSQKEAMLGTLAKIRNTYGSVEKCVVDLGLLSLDGIRQLQSNLIVDVDEKGVLSWQDHAKLLL
ncbi:tyrosine phosphatase family-domain-containing protein [Daldinia decipiens]|uniref:tyrosine phosphatase family-domain-containing protein n=1 Tax=Daldinia decipiens TaxID=326647 RepID=UPI0020C4521C|nr:tyrosine phosphatase family-domain-containing protein [Daldinia decipiens]KAI1662503.1 tyrosine phosphatase family-domain-containing protein [Daldinia decipiens]